MTNDRNYLDNQETRIWQHQHQNQGESSSISATTAGSSTATRVRAREGDDVAMARAAMLRGQYVDVCDYYARSFQRGVAPGIQREFATRIRDGMSADVIMAAIDDTMAAPRPSWAYCIAILRRCDAEGVKTLKEWNDRKSRYQSEKNPALNYIQREYTEDMFGEDFFVDLDKYVRG